MSDRSLFRVRLGRFYHQPGGDSPPSIDMDLSVRQLLAENDGYRDFVECIIEDCLGKRAHYDDSDYSENVVCIYFLVNDGRKPSG